MSDDKWRSNWRISKYARARPKERYKLADVARLFGVTGGTVRNWIRTGKLSASHPRPRVWLIRSRAINRLMLDPRMAALAGRAYAKGIQAYLGEEAIALGDMATAVERAATG